MYNSLSAKGEKYSGENVGSEERRDFFVEYYLLHTAEYATGF